MELKKLPGDVKTGEDIVKWMRFFNGKRREEFEEMAKSDKYLGEAYHTLVKLSADEEKRMEYEVRQKALRDYNSQIGSAERRGIAIGEERGITIGKQQGIEIGEQRTKQVFKLYLSGKDMEEIAQVCDITLDEVKKILED